MTLSEKLRLIAKGLSKERVTTTQARSAAPYISHAADVVAVWDALDGLPFNDQGKPRAEAGEARCSESA